ncbi:hypothetical protein GWI33_009004, partial [Rhynchophorus ferrugineus]
MSGFEDLLRLVTELYDGAKSSDYVAGYPDIPQ